MREIKLLITCDNCGNATEETDCTNVTYHFDGLQWEQDLCWSCFAPVSGRKVTKSSSTQEGIWQCHHCQSTFASKRGLNQHITKKHTEKE